MPTTISLSEFDKDPRLAIDRTADGPVFIKENGVHAFALITIKEYRRLGGPGESIMDLLAVPDGDYFDFEFPRMGDEPIQPADLSD